MDINSIFLNAMNCIKENYSDFNFIVGRDLVWTIQKRLISVIKQVKIPYDVYNDYPIETGLRRSLSCDLAIVKKSVKYKDVLNGISAIEIAVEYKFEPSIKREEILRHKLPVVGWGDVCKDIDRIKRYADKTKALISYAFFIDEDSSYKGRYTEPTSIWED